MLRIGKSITLGASTPRGPSIPAGGPRVKPISGGAPASRNKKGHTGTIAGVGHHGRGRVSVPGFTGASPHGPKSHAAGFPTRLPNRPVTPAASQTPARGLLGRIMRHFGGR